MFGKKEKHNLMQLKTGYTLKVQNTTWTIQEFVDYDWGVDGKSIEYTLKAIDGNIAYLEVERHDGDYELTFLKQVTFNTAELEEAIQSKSVIYNGVLFELEDQYQGSAKNQTRQTSWESVKNYMFYSTSEDIISIEVFSEKQPEAFYGSEIKEKSIKNIKGY